MELEETARLIGDNPLALERELKSAFEVMFDQDQKRFSKKIFDLKNKRMLSDDGTKALQWKLRSNPNQPISHDNQQTSRGYVSIVLVDPATVTTKLAAHELYEPLEVNLDFGHAPSYDLLRRILLFLKAL